MSHHPAHSGKKPPASANAIDRQAATALDHLQRGRYRDAMECYKGLVKTEPRPEWLAGLSSAYEGRAKALAAKAMRREAIALWRSRAEVCHQPLWEGPYASWLVAEGHITEVLTHLSERCTSAPSLDDSDGELDRLHALLAPALLTADEAICAQLPADALLTRHRPIALAALTAYARKDTPALEDALAGISFRSPYRDLRTVLKALVLWESDRAAARAAIARVPPYSPFEPLAAPLRSVAADSDAERWHRFAKLSSDQQSMAIDLLGCPPPCAPMLKALACADPALAPDALFELVQRHARGLPQALATQLWKWLAPWAKRKGCANPLIFGAPNKADEECATALAVEIKGELDHAQEHWIEAVPLLAASGDADDRLRAAMVLRHIARMKKSTSSDGTLNKESAEHLTRSLEFDPGDCDVHVELVANWRRQGDLQKARQRLEAGLALFPDHVALLTEAVEVALAGGAFKKAISAAKRLLAHDPLNRKVRSLLGNAHLSHAGKHIAADKLELARKEIEQARSWLVAEHDQARLQLLQAWTEPEGSTERLRLARQAASAWGGGLAAGWRLVREAQELFARVGQTSAHWLLDEAGIAPTQVLTPLEILALVKVLEHEPPPARKGADPLLPWRKALLALAAAPLFDPESSERICEAWGRHKEHDLQEKFANAARKRWPDRPVFVYHAVAARFGKSGRIVSNRDFDDLEGAQEHARRSKNLKLVARIEALFEADGPVFEDLQQDNAPAELSPQDLQALRSMLEATAKSDGGKLFLEKARLNLGKELVDLIEQSCGNDKKLFMSRIIDLAVLQMAGADLPSAVGKPHAAPIAPSKPKKVISKPDPAQGQLFNE